MRCPRGCHANGVTTIIMRQILFSHVRQVKTSRDVSIKGAEIKLCHILVLRTLVWPLKESSCGIAPTKTERPKTKYLKKTQYRNVFLLICFSDA